MGEEKKGSKGGGGGGGGYVGGFLQLFDWNGKKSKKKLFSNKSDYREEPRKGKRSHSTSPATQNYVIDEDENASSSIKGSSDYSYASSVADEEANVVKAPGVVARLMGLESLPTSSVAESYNTPYFDSRYLRDIHYRRTPEFPYEHQILHSGKLPTRLDGVSHNRMESTPQKLMNRPIEKFQTEALPPRSAKSISITHHKLLSPIKNPGFIPTKNAAQIMEAAARIIEPGPRANTKGKMPPVGSSSVPLKLQNLKEKIESVQKSSKLSESSQKPVESKAVKYLKGQSLNKSWNGVEDAPQLRPSSSHSEDGRSASLKSKGKSVSLAVQAKVNVQRREGLSSTSSWSVQGQKEHSEFKLSQPFKSQQNAPKYVQKKPALSTTSGVLRQNNQKQNCPKNMDKLQSKASMSNQQGRRTLPGDGSFGRKKPLNKVMGNSKARTWNTGLDTNDSEKVVQLSTTAGRPRKKRSLEEDLYFEKNGTVDNIFLDKDEMHTQQDTPIEAHSKLVEDNRRKGMDVVSFTFTSPMKKPMPGSQSSKQVLEKHNSFNVGFSYEKVPTTKTKLLSLGLNDIGGDTLSILLEQKLKELTYGIGSSFNGSMKSGDFATFPSGLPDFVSGRNGLRTNPDECDDRLQSADKLSSVFESSSLSTEDPMLRGAEELGDHSVNSYSEGQKEFNCRQPSPISTLEPPFSNESCNSSDSGGDSTSINGSRQCSSVQSEQVVDSNCPQKLLLVESDMELSDSASSTLLGSTNGELATLSNSTNLARTDNWELEYVREVICNAESMFKNFILGHSKEITNPDVFDHLENWKTWSKSDSEEYNESRLRRKVLFDCVGECLDLRCIPYVGGACRGRARGETMFRRKDWLAQDIYKEISGWKSMGDWILDGLVDKDMSTKYGKWLDFEIEEFELGVEIGRGILSSLVDEVVADIFLG